MLSAIGRRGLLVLDTSPGDPSLGGSAASNLPRVAVDIDIDARPDALAIDDQLAALEARARQTGFAVGIAKGYPVTIERLVAWSRAHQDKNLALAPVSALAADLILPTAMWVEKEGAYGNAERRTQFWHQLVTAPGESR